MDGASTSINAIAEGIRLIDQHRHDGHPFGLPPGCGDDAYILAIDDDGHATLRRVDAAAAGPDLARLEPDQWARVSPVVIADFNRRLDAKGLPAGRFPERGGHVTLHPCFGREIELAMLVGGDGDIMGSDALQTWDGLGGLWRLRLWRLLRARHSVVTDVENRDSLRAAAMASAAMRRARAARAA